MSMHDRQISGSWFPVVFHVMAVAVLAQPNAQMGSLPSLQSWNVGNPVEGKYAYSIARTYCNVGDAPLDWFSNPNPNHPVVISNFYRLHNGRFEQIGQGWASTVFCALQASLCATCIPVGNCCCSQLGVGCSDSSSALRSGNPGILGPRSEINVHMGIVPGTHSIPQGPDALRGRIIIAETDLDDENYPDALFFAETQIVSAHEAQSGDMSGDNDNASYRRAIVNPNNFFMGMTGSTIRGEPAIHAWPANDTDVTLENIDIPNEGRLILGHKASPNTDGTWHYEYALHNLTSDRAVGSFIVPVPADVTLTNIGFHDIDSHSGEPYCTEDWLAVRSGDTITWSSDSFEENEFANAIRWGTIYNFRFDANTPPRPADLDIGLFKPGTPKSVSTVVAAPLPACPIPALATAFEHTPFADHAFDGYIDPRGESTDGKLLDLGLDRIKLVFNTPIENADGETLSADAFSITDSRNTAPIVTSISTEDNRVITLNMSAPLTVAAWTTITVNARSQCSQTALAENVIAIGFLPGDVDQNGSVTPVDLLIYRQYLNEITAPPVGVVTDYLDTDRNGDVSPLDLFAYRQLINGVNPATRIWAGQQLPAKP